MYRWRVWFTDQKEPVEVVTREAIELHAIATAMDMRKLSWGSRVRTVRVERLKPQEQP